MTAGLEEGFLAIRPALRFALDPLTPLSWALDAALYASPQALVVPGTAVGGFVFLVSKSIKIAGLVAGLAFFLFTDHYTYAMETLAIIFVCTVICVLLGVPLHSYVQERSRPASHHADIGYAANAAYLRLPDSVDFLVQDHRAQTYGLMIIMYAIVPVVRLTNLGIRLVDQSVIEAANAYGLTSRQKLVGVEIPLALPNIMAGVKPS